MWTDNNPPEYDDLRVFGCLAYAHICRNKLDPQALKRVFLGYGDWVKGYRLWYKDAKPPKMIVSRDMPFNELTIVTPACQQLREAPTSSEASTWAYKLDPAWQRLITHDKWLRYTFNGVYMTWSLTCHKTICRGTNHVSSAASESCVRPDLSFVGMYIVLCQKSIWVKITSINSFCIYVK